MAHKNYDELKKAILAKARKGMVKEVMPYVQNRMVDAIDKTVYDVHSPKQYSRRKYSDGGLADRDNIVGQPLTDTWGSRSGFDFEVYNKAKTNFDYARPKTYLAPLVIMGQDKMKSVGVDIRYQYYQDSDPRFDWYARPRDFITETKNKLDKQTMSLFLKDYMNDK